MVAKRSPSSYWPHVVTRKPTSEGTARCIAVTALALIMAMHAHGGLRWLAVALLVLAGAATCVADLAISPTRPTLRCVAFASVDATALVLVSLVEPAFWVAITVVASVAATSYAVRLPRRAFAVYFVVTIASLTVAGARQDVAWPLPLLCLAVAVPPIAVAAPTVRFGLRLQRVEDITSSVQAIVWGAFADRGMVELLGPVERLTGMPRREFIRWHGEQSSCRVAELAPGETCDHTIELFHRRKHENVWLRQIVTRHGSPDRPSYRGVITDVSALVVAQRSADRLAHRDRVTDGLNAAGFHRAVQSIPVAELDGLALVIVRIRHLGRINDLWGRAEADRCVDEIHRRLVAAVPAARVIARLTDNEFGVVLALDGASPTSLELDVESALSLQVIDCAGTAFDPNLAIHAEPMSPSVPYDETLRTTDFALRLLPDEARHKERLSSGIDPRLLSARLESVIDVWYQSIHHAVTGEVVALEALARYLVNGVPVNTEQVIDVVQTFGLVPRLDRHVLRKVVADIASAGCLPACALRFSVNMSRRTLSDPGLADFVRSTCAAAGVDPRRLCIEVSERDVSADHDEMVRTLSALGTLGVAVSIDDYGTGHSSLSDIAALPIGEIKIDRSLVSGLCTSETDRIIVRSTVHLAKALQMRVVAEGVESEAVLAEARSLGCDLVQGFHFAKATPLAQVTRPVCAPACQR